MVIAKQEVFLIRLSDIISGGICAGCVCQAEICTKLHVLRLNLRTILRAKHAIVFYTGRIVITIYMNFC